MMTYLFLAGKPPFHPAAFHVLMKHAQNAPEGSFLRGFLWFMFWLGVVIFVISCFDKDSSSENEKNGKPNTTLKR